MLNSRPTIFVTNDDGITAPGLRTLIRIMQKLGRVVVVAPDRPRSGQGHAITVSLPLRVSPVVQTEDYEEHRCNGTPVDCVKLGVQIVLRKRPDLLVSGINHGSNASINVVYSGTMAAVIEAAIDNIPAIGFSIDDYDLNGRLDHIEEYVEQIAREVLQKGLPKGTCLNVNFPAWKNEEIKGVMVCRQSLGSWKEHFDERVDPYGRNYYWITGVFSNPDHVEGTDTWALEHNYISLVPMKFDLTHHEVIHTLRTYQFEPRLHGVSVIPPAHPEGGD